MVIIYLAQFNSSGQKYQKLYGLLLALAAFAGLLCKETIWFLFPLLLFFFVRDMLKKVRISFWLISIIAIMMFFYLLWLYKSIVLTDFTIKKQAQLKVYIWNNLKTNLEIKDANVELVTH